MVTHRILALVLVVLAGCILTNEEAVAGSPAAGPVMLVSGPSPFEQGCDGGASFEFMYYYHNYEVEPYVAVNPLNPLNIVVSWQQDRWLWGGASGMVAAATHDGGATWSRTVIPGLTLCSGGVVQRIFDPWLSFAPNGELYHIAVVSEADFTKGALLVSKSTDGGNTWGAPVAVHTNNSPNGVDDKQTITADPYDSKYVYVAWRQTQFGTGTQPTVNARHSNAVKAPSWFTRTTDGGATWEPARMIFDPGEHGSTTGHQIVVLPNGDLLNAFAVTSDEQNAHKTQMNIAVMRSTDKGQTWSAPVVIEGLNPAYVYDPTTGEFLITGSSLIDIAVDKRNGNVYIVWEDGRFSGYAREGIAFMKSTDAGLTWSAATQVNAETSTQAFTPSISVADNGAIAVTYYDFRNDTSDPAILQTDHWIVVSRDGGESWTEAHVGGPFDMRSAPEPRAPWYFIGDYVGLTSAGNSFVAAFPMANFGMPSNPTDIFVSTIMP